MFWVSMSPPLSHTPLGILTTHSLSLLFSTLGEFLPSDSRAQLQHRPAFSFCMDPYICIPSPEPLPNMVVNGVLQGFYGFSISTPDTQPEAPCHSAPLPLMPIPSQRPQDHMPGQSFASVL